MGAGGRASLDQGRALGLQCAWDCFFFQAEDGIRDGTVTGLQTCALPISGQPAALADVAGGLMIGVDSGVQRRVTTVKVPAGALLCFYTDGLVERPEFPLDEGLDRKSTRLNSSHSSISYAVFCLKKKKKNR